MIYSNIGLTFRETVPLSSFLDPVHVLPTFILFLSEDFASGFIKKTSALRRQMLSAHVCSSLSLGDNKN